MSLPFRVKLQGFTVFERSAISSYFRLAANRSPAYEQVDTAAEAHFLIVDADHVEAVRTVVGLGRVADGVFIGAQAPEGATAWMMRPIDPLHVLRELDAMVATLAPLRAPPTPTSGTDTVHTAHAGRTQTLPPRPGTTPTRRSSDNESSGPGNSFVGVAAAPAPAPAATATVGDALLVDDSEIALRFLEAKLQRLGLQTERAVNSGRAIELLSRHPYDFVFVDVELGTGSDLDGLALCQHIKRQHHPPAGARSPVVAMVSAHHSELDRVRGMLAGADGYLGKPLDEAALLRLLAQNGITPPKASEEPELL